MKMIPSGWRETYKEAVDALRTTHFFQVIILMAFILLLASTAMYLVERRNFAVQGFLDSIWWALVTVTTVGYGDIVPTTIIGRVIAFGLMISGMILVSLFTAAIASVFVSRRIKEGKGLENVRDRDHIVICGWNPGGMDLIHGVINHFKPKIPVIVLVNELPREEVDSILYRFGEAEFRYVRGNFTKEEILARANVKHAQVALILSDTDSHHPYEKADERTIFGSMALKAVAPKIRICAELKNAENREHLKRANVDHIVVRGEFNPAMLAGAASGTGLAMVMKKLFDLDEPNTLWRTKISERFVGRTVGELSEHMRKKYSAILLAIVTEAAPMRLEDILSSDASAIDGFIRKKFEESGRDYFTGSKTRTSVQLNPPYDYVITRHDAAIVLSRVRPDHASILEKSLDLVTGAGRSGK